MEAPTPTPASGSVTPVSKIPMTSSGLTTPYGSRPGSPVRAETFNMREIAKKYASPKSAGVYGFREGGAILEKTRTAAQEVFLKVGIQWEIPFELTVPGFSTFEQYYLAQAAISDRAATRILSSGQGHFKKWEGLTPETLRELPSLYKLYKLILDSRARGTSRVSTQELCQIGLPNTAFLLTRVKHGDDFPNEKAALVGAFTPKNEEDFKTEGDLDIARALACPRISGERGQVDQVAHLAKAYFEKGLVIKARDCILSQPEDERSITIQRVLEIMPDKGIPYVFFAMHLPLQDRGPHLKLCAEEAATEAARNTYRLKDCLTLLGHIDDRVLREQAELECVNTFKTSLTNVLVIVDTLRNFETFEASKKLVEHLVTLMSGTGHSAAFDLFDEIREKDGRKGNEEARLYAYQHWFTERHISTTEAKGMIRESSDSTRKKGLLIGYAHSSVIKDTNSDIVTKAAGLREPDEIRVLQEVVEILCNKEHDWSAATLLVQSKPHMSLYRTLAELLIGNSDQKATVALMRYAVKNVTRGDRLVQQMAEHAKHLNKREISDAIRKVIGLPSLYKDQVARGWWFGRIFHPLWGSSG